MREVRYAIVIEHGPKGASAYVPDLPGCVAAGATVEEVKSLMREALLFHIEGLRSHGQAVPAPTHDVDYVEV
jgi:predicted RNase H-like HicB family nuclease